MFHERKAKWSQSGQRTKLVRKRETLQPKASVLPVAFGPWFAPIKRIFINAYELVILLISAMWSNDKLSISNLARGIPGHDLTSH